MVIRSCQRSRLEKDSVFRTYRPTRCRSVLFQYNSTTTLPSYGRIEGQSMGMVCWIVGTARGKENTLTSCLQGTPTRRRRGKRRPCPFIGTTCRQQAKHLGDPLCLHRRLSARREMRDGCHRPKRPTGRKIRKV